MTDLLDVVDVMAFEHREILRLTAVIGRSPNPHQRRDLTDTIIAELVRHSFVEQLWVCPAARRDTTGDPGPSRHDEDWQRDVDNILRRLERTDVEDVDFDSLIDRIRLRLIHHAAREQDDCFPQLRIVLSDEQRCQLALRVRWARQLARTRPDPAMPHARLFQQAFDPGIGMADRMRETLQRQLSGV